MTTTETIDGVPREQLVRWEEMLRTPPGRQELIDELRALLDADPVLSKGITYKTGLPRAAYCCAPINYGALDPVERLSVCRGEVAPVAVARLEMSHVVRAHMEIPGCPVLTSNQCHTLAMKLNACLDELKRLNGIER